VKIQFKHTCMDDDCKVVTLLERARDGMTCPECSGPVLTEEYKQKPEISNRARYVNSELFRRCVKGCLNLKAESVQTILEIGDGYLTTEDYMKSPESLVTLSDDQVERIRSMLDRWDKGMEITNRDMIKVLKWGEK
jgi:hypothetical protein